MKGNGWAIFNLETGRLEGIFFGDKAAVDFQNIYPGQLSQPKACRLELNFELLPVPPQTSIPGIFYLKTKKEDKE